MYDAKSIVWHEKVHRRISGKKRLHDHHSIIRTKPVDEKIPYVGVTEEDIIALVDTAAIIHSNILKQTEATNKITRFFLLLVFFQASIAMVLNVYNLVIFYLLTADNPASVEFTLSEAMFFHGFNIWRSISEILWTIVAFSLLYYKIDDLARLVNEFNLYAKTDNLRNRLLQFSVYAQTSLRSFTIFGAYELNGTLVSGVLSATATYIVILTQYGMEFELTSDSNKTQQAT